MLTVDPVKRATIAEIRSMPFFQEGLPRYLQPLPEMDSYPTLPMDDLQTLLLVNEGQMDPQKVAEQKGLVFTEELGIIDPEIVTELLEKITTYNEAMVWEALQDPKDNQVKVAYQLVRDHKRLLKDCEFAFETRFSTCDMFHEALAGFDEEDANTMEDFLASSPPAWNTNIPVSCVTFAYRTRSSSSTQRPASISQTGPEEMDWEDEEQDIQDIPGAHFEVLDTSLPGHSSRGLAPGVASFQADCLTEAPSLPGSNIGTPPIDYRASPRPPTPPRATPAKEKPLQKPKWHFGIRSRSPPMEVMLEIYKTLGVLGMQWRRKDGINMPEVGGAPPGGYPEEVNQAIEQWSEETGCSPSMGKKAPNKKEAGTQDKAAQKLYLVETRAQYGDVMVRKTRSSIEVVLTDVRRSGWTCSSIA